MSKAAHNNCIGKKSHMKKYPFERFEGNKQVQCPSLGRMWPGSGYVWSNSLQFHMTAIRPILLYCSYNIQHVMPVCNLVHANCINIKFVSVISCNLLNINFINNEFGWILLCNLSNSYFINMKLDSAQPDNPPNVGWMNKI